MAWHLVDLDLVVAMVVVDTIKSILYLERTLMSEEREFKVSGGALRSSQRKRTTTRKNRQDGGDNSGALMQLANQSAPAFTMDLDSQKLASEYQTQVGKILATNIGPNKIQQFGGRKSQKGGDSTGAIVNLASTRSTQLPPGSPDPSPVVSGISPSQPAPVGGGACLLPPKRKTRIALKAKKYGGSASEKSNVPPMPGGSMTKKARKIHLRVKGVTARIAKAKKAKRTAMTAPISEVRAKLEAAKVIKKGSKAPEAMLRTMYADLLITKKGL